MWNAHTDATKSAQVSHAYLHAESTPAGRLNDGSIVAQANHPPFPPSLYTKSLRDHAIIL